MGTLQYIQKTIPEALDKASKELRVKQELMHRVYAMIPRKYKNKYHCKRGINMVNNIWHSWIVKTTPIYHLIDASGDFKMDKWIEVEQRARNYVEQCK